MEVLTFDPPVITDHYDMQGSWNVSPQEVYRAEGEFGDIVDRITISATGDMNNTKVAAKLIYIYLYDDNNDSYSLYKTLAMPEITLDEATGVTNPELELVFTGGLLLRGRDKILIGASKNYGITNQRGDYLSVTIEGGTYNQQ